MMYSADTGTRVPLTFGSDAYKLTGVLHLPDKKKSPVVIGSHGLFSDGDSPKQIALADVCNRHGIAFFRFHHRGCGRSEGRFVDVTTLEARRNDLTNAVATVLSRGDISNRFGIFGSSMGGATAIAATAELNPAALVTLAAPVRSAPILSSARTTGDLRGLPVSFYQNRLSFDLSHALQALTHILVIHGEKDAVVPVAHAHEIFQNAKEPKKIRIHPGGDHQVSDIDHQRQFITDTAEWFREHL